MSRSSRKLDHIHQALEQNAGCNGLHDVSFVHNSLPSVNMSNISLESFVGGLQLSSPIIINAMTGGAIETLNINEKLAIVASETSIPMAVGSQMAAIRNQDVRNTYQIARKMNPNGMIIANLGGEATTTQALEAIEMLEANALQIHLNPMQELIMPEGDRNFEGVLERIGSIVQHTNVPVFVKEVGFGMSRESCQKLIEVGVKVIDVGGAGGTNFAEIENSRREIPISFLNNWGMNTCISLLEVSSFRKNLSIMASGGIVNSLHIAKSISLGASAIGMAGPILKAIVNQGTDTAISMIEVLKDELRLIMTALGTQTILDLQHAPIVITGETRQWCEARQIDYKSFASYRSV